MSGSVHQVKKQQANAEQHTFIGQVPVGRTKTRMGEGDVVLENGSDCEMSYPSSGI
jgi:hypothetical protein